jgi:Holliday junction resolvase RusA-like endonuclease
LIITFTVYGIAQTAGSKRAFPFKKSDGSLGVRVSDDNLKGRSWKNAVASSAREMYRGQLLSGPLAVTMRFFRPRPQGHFGKSGLNKTGLNCPSPISRPDVLKLARCAEDSLTGVLWRDDAQIVEEHLFKHWGEPARMEIEIQELVQAEALLFEPKPTEAVAPWEKTA